MSGLILCTQTRAKKPLFVKSLGKNIASIEELCFFLYYHIYLLDDRLVGLELVDWIHTELGLASLARELKMLITRKAGMEAFAVHILQSTGYLTEEALQEYERKLKDIKEAPPLERAKKRADYLTRTGSYNKAIREYRKILKQEEAKESNFRSDIFHNLGVAYGRIFAFTQSSECFLEAFRLSLNLESLRQYKLVIKLSENNLQEDEVSKEFPLSETLDQQIEEKIRKIIEEDRTGRELLDKLNELKEENKLSEYYKQLEKILCGWQEECRRYMNG